MVKSKLKIINNTRLISKLSFIIIINIEIFYLFYFRTISSNKIGVVCVRHEVNIGNNLLKYAISVKLKELGYIPYIIGTVWSDYNNIDFINKTTNLIIIKKNFSEIKPNDYNILMVNSDQTWFKFDNNFYDYGFLKFAENWKIPRFIYGASFLQDFWPFSPEDEEIAKNLLKKFSGISVREKDSVKLIKKHLGITPEFVLDPTLLIDKQYYLDLIKDYKGNKTMNENYIFVYQIGNYKYITDLMEIASKKFNFEIYYLPLNNGSLVQNFLYYLINSKAVITNSFHGTIFSIIFNKPFISIYKNGTKNRFNSLAYLFNISERLHMFGQKYNYNLLIKPLNIKYELLNKYRQISINFLKTNLNKTSFI